MTASLAAYGAWAKVLPREPRFTKVANFGALPSLIPAGQTLLVANTRFRDEPQKAYPFRLVN